MDENNAITILTPTTTLEEFSQEAKRIIELVRSEMREGQDYGIIPGTKKKTLFDPGAEKLAKYFGLVPRYTLVKEVEDFETGFYYYKYKCELTHFQSGRPCGEAERSCNSREKKYYYKNVSEKYASEQDKNNYLSRFQNDKGYWILKVALSTPELTELINTFQAMAQKRAFVEAVKTATMASEIFHSDNADMRDNGDDQSPQKDKIRQMVMARLFAIAKGRGFSEEGTKAGAYKKYNVDSITKLTNAQINEYADHIMTTFAEVGPGEKSRKIGTSEPQPPQESSGPVVSDPVDPAPEPRIKCRQCDKEVPVHNTQKYFCNIECQNAYWHKKPAKEYPWEKRADSSTT